MHGLCFFEARLSSGHTLIHKAPEPKHARQRRLAQQAQVEAGPDRVPLMIRRSVSVKHALKEALRLALFASIMQSVPTEPISDWGECRIADLKRKAFEPFCSGLRFATLAGVLI
jgi:hypothetical protein